MLTPQERAKQFIPSRNYKRLREALKDREERHSREDILIPDEEGEKDINDTLKKLRKGMKISIKYYRAFHNISRTDIISYINFPSGFFLLGHEKVFFNDIYRLEIIDF